MDCAVAHSHGHPRAVGHPDLSAYFAVFRVSLNSRLREDDGFAGFSLSYTNANPLGGKSRQALGLLIHHDGDPAVREAAQDDGHGVLKIVQGKGVGNSRVQPPPCT